MAQTSIAVVEERSNLAGIAATVYSTGRPVAVYRDEKPWVVISPARDGNSSGIDWTSQKVVPANRATGVTVLPGDWDCPEDDGLYDDLA